MSNRTHKKTRIDQLLVSRNLVSSRQKAQALILSAQVLVNDEPITKSGTLVGEDAEIRLRGSDQSAFVSRSADKLLQAFQHFNIDAKGKTAIDIGASTGGFTQILLLNRVRKVFAVDVGSNQLDWKIRKNKRVVSLEKLNARTMSFVEIGEKVPLMVMDVSFISQTKVIPNLIQFLLPQAECIFLIKPQFELEPDRIEKGGLVTRAEDQEEAVARVVECVKSNNFSNIEVIPTRLKGQKGNQEFLLYCRAPS